MQRNDDRHQRENPYATRQWLPNPPDAVANKASSLQDLNPFWTIWTQPRDTVGRIIAVNPELHVVLLACLSGIGSTLDRASMRNAGDSIPMAAILVMACVLGPLAGLFSLWLGSHLIRLSGMWIGGVGNRQHIKTAIAWGAVPAVFALPLWIPQLLLFGSDMFTQETPRLDAQPLLLIPLLGITFIELVLSIWAFVLLCNTIAQVQGFRSAWLGLGNVLLAGVVLIVPLLAIVFVVVLLSRA